MEQVYKMAVKTSKPGSKVDPIDKVMMFLQEEQKALKEKKEKEKQKAIEEILKDQNELAKVNHEVMKTEIKKEWSSKEKLQDQKTSFLQTDDKIRDKELSKSTRMTNNFLAQTQSVSRMDAKLKTKDDEEEKQSNPEDNMSLAEIVARRFKKNIKVKKLKTPEDAASILIKDTKEFDVNDNSYTEGTQTEQEKMQLGEVTTDLSRNWKDMDVIKQNLWDRLHGVSSSVKKNIDKEMNRLAQLMQKHKQRLAQASSSSMLTAGGMFDSLYSNLGHVKLGAEVEPPILITLIVLSVLLFLCCCCYWTACCCVRSASNQARKEQEDFERKEAKKAKQKKQQLAKERLSARSSQKEWSHFQY